MSTVPTNKNDNKRLFRIRTITAFVSLSPKDFESSRNEHGSVSTSSSSSGNEGTATASTSGVRQKLQHCSDILRTIEKQLNDAKYEVQTIRIATNPFGEYLLDSTEESSRTMPNPNDITSMERLQTIDSILDEYNIQFCSLGPSQSVQETILLCPKIIATSGKFSCSANVNPTDVMAAKAVAECFLTISKLGENHETNDSDSSPSSLPPSPHLVDGIGNFRFCAAASCKPYIPFFPAAKCESYFASNDGGTLTIGFALGLENGALVKDLLQKSKSISQTQSTFRDGMTQALLPLERICETLSKTMKGVSYLGIDSSCNPSLDEGGSIAEAIETLDEVGGIFGNLGTLAAAAAITTALQSLSPDITLTGYCGLMLPVCEDRRLAYLASARPSRLRIAQLLNISSVCGVGVDTIPVPAGDCAGLTSLILDIAGLAGRWGKSLSCRVFPLLKAEVGDETTFDSPYMCNTRVFSLD